MKEFQSRDEYKVRRRGSVNASMDMWVEERQSREQAARVSRQLGNEKLGAFYQQYESERER